MPLSHPLLQLFAADPALGRLDADSLSDQALMEMLVDGMKDPSKKKLQDDKGNYKDVSEWASSGSVQVVFVDDRVTQIEFKWMAYTDKQFPFAFIPPLVTSFSLIGCSLHGTLETAVLPQNLLHLNVRTNKLHGPLNFKGFPRKLQILSIGGNCFSGNCALGELPSTLVRFAANDNYFEGELSLNDLPEALESLEVARNQLSGSLEILRLPQGLRVMQLQENNFWGDLRLLALPPSLRGVNVGENELSGRAVLLGVQSYKSMHFDLLYDFVTTVLDEGGRRHAWEGNIIDFNFMQNSEDEEEYLELLQEAGSV